MKNFSITVKTFGNKIKKNKDKLATPILKFLVFLKISPLILSLLAVILGVLSAFYISSSREMFIILISISFFFDILDGALARYKGKNSGQGFWFDYILDRIVVLSVMTAVYFTQTEPNWIYLSTPLIYILVHLIYAFNKNKLLMIYVHPIYFVLLYFNFFAASVLSFSVDIVNLLLFIFLFLFTSSKKRK